MLQWSKYSKLIIKRCLCIGFWKVGDCNLFQIGFFYKFKFFFFTFKKDNFPVIIYLLTALYIGKKEGNILFNYVLNNCCYMVLDILLRTTEIARRNSLPLLVCYSFQLVPRQLYIYHSPECIVHIMAFITPVVEPWLEQEIAFHWCWIHWKPVSHWQGLKVLFIPLNCTHSLISNLHF